MVVVERRSTRERVLEGALSAFAERGFAATSLDELGSQLGLTKQAILYHFGSKDGLLSAVIEVTAVELVEVFETEVDQQLTGFERIESVVRVTFRLAARRPEVLGLLRQVSRLGDPHTTALAAGLRSLMDRANNFLEHEMAAGRLRRHEPRFLLLSAYSAVIGVATEPEVMRAMGVEPNLRSLAEARSELTSFLRDALVP
ncbi:MAG: TetR/AcrR family transcriptional regulator [Actinomycetia bacterium]|nr:TetR/AcrR family transcriptional regulator [Actinomycetes bacterium]MCP4963438.1 TetR/AcrR family transcriptional regulator [Actinomycetes bacterium]